MANEDIIKKLSIELPNISPATLGKLDSLIKDITKNIESATAIGEKFFTFNKQIENLANGKVNASFGFAVNPDSVEQIEKVIQATLKSKVFGTAQLKTSDLKYKTHDIELLGSQSVASAKKALIGQGSELVPKGDNTFSVFTPYNMSQARKGHAGEPTVNKLLAPAFEKSNAEKENELKIKQQLKEKEEIKQQETKKEEVKGVGHNLLTFLKLGTIVTSLRTLVSLARKILSATLQNAQEKLSQVISETGLSLPSGTLRAYQFLEEQKGLEAGTFEDVFTSLRDKFADIGNIDLSALEKLAPMLKDSTVDLIQSGVGGKNPEVLAKEIISDVLSNIMLGKNAYGQKVGTPEEALKDVIPILNSVDSGLSDILSRFVYESTHGTLGATAPTGIDSWLSNPELNPYSISSVDLSMLEELADSSNKLKTQFDLLGEKLAVSFAGGLNSFLKWLSSFRFMMSPDEKVALNYQNYETNKANLAELQEIEPKLKSQANFYNQTNFVNSKGNVEWNKIDTEEELENAMQYYVYHTAHEKVLSTIEELNEQLEKEPSHSNENVKDVAITKNDILSSIQRTKHSYFYAQGLAFANAGHRDGKAVYTEDDYMGDVFSYGLNNGFITEQGDLVEGKTYKELYNSAKNAGIKRNSVGDSVSEALTQRFYDWAKAEKLSIYKASTQEDFLREVIGNEGLENAYNTVDSIVSDEPIFSKSFNFSSFNENLKKVIPLEDVWDEEKENNNSDNNVYMKKGSLTGMSVSSAQVELAIKVDGENKGNIIVDSNGNVSSEGDTLDLIGITQNRTGLPS